MIERFIEMLLRRVTQLSPLDAGYNSEVYLVDAGQERVVVKVIGRKKALHSEEAVTLGHRAEVYRQRLVQAGIKVPAFLEWGVLQDGTNLLVLVEPYSGVNGKELLLRSTDPSTVVLGLLDAVAPLLMSTGAVGVGIDPKPENFVYQEGWTYVDVMPPRYRDGNEFLVEHPAPTTSLGMELGKWKHYTVDGILTVLLTQLSRILPRSFPQFKQTIADWSRAHGLQFRCEAFHPSNVREIDNPYELRLVMCDLAWRDGIEPGLVEEFFRRTHFEDTLPEETIRWAQNRIAEIHSGLRGG